VEQKFDKYDYVRIAKDLGSSMSHFTADEDAIVIASYHDLYGGSDDNHHYCIYIKGHGETSWYYEHQLTLIEHGRKDLLKQWKAEAAARYKQHSDLDWIFAQGEEIFKDCPSGSIEALAACFGLTNLWGANGEGVTYLSNSIATLNLALPFLLKKDKEGWLAACEGIKQKMAERGR